VRLTRVREHVGTDEEDVAAAVKWSPPERVNLRSIESLGGNFESAALAAPKEEFPVGRKSRVDLFRKGIDAMPQVTRRSPAAITLKRNIEVLARIGFAGRDQILRAAAIRIIRSRGGGKDQCLAIGRDCGSDLSELGIDFRTKPLRRKESASVPTGEKDMEMARLVIAIGDEVERAVGRGGRIEVAAVVLIDGRRKRRRFGPCAGIAFGNPDAQTPGLVLLGGPDRGEVKLVAIGAQMRRYRRTCRRTKAFAAKSSRCRSG
jgi:hypothetical protein